MNYFPPTKKPVGWATDTVGRRKRVYDKPATPFDRLSLRTWVKQSDIDDGAEPGLETRLHGHCRDVPPAEFEAAFYAAHRATPAGVGTQ